MGEKEEKSDGDKKGFFGKVKDAFKE